MKQFDMIVIGGGGAGLSAAFTAAGFGKKVLLAEKNKTGGECTWYGCIPSKTLINIARKQVAGNHFSGSPFAQINEVRNLVYSHESPEVLQKRGVETVTGTASFTGSDTVQINGEHYRARRFVLASGSRAMVPPVPGLDQTPFLTNETLFELDKLPENLLIMGGGPIGTEMAQALSRLGVRVTLVEMLDRILFREEPDTAAVIRDQLIKDGVTIMTGTQVISAAHHKNGVALVAKTDGTERILEAQQLLIAVGRSSAAEELNPEAAGIITTPKGVKVNSKLQTSNRKIYAAGDIAGPYTFSHMAEYQGVTAALNAVLPFKKRVSYRHVPWVTFSDPELARSGLTEDEARKKFGRRVQVYTQRFEDLDRGRTAPGTRGLVKIILGPKGRILGAHIAGPRAGELICEVQVLKTFGIAFHKLKNVIHPYPVYADILRQIAKKAALDRVLNHPFVRFVRIFQRKTE